MSAQDSSSEATLMGSRLRASIAALGDIARVYGRHLPNRPAIEFEGRRITYAEFDLRTSRVAQALTASAVKPGERIAYLGKNCDTYLELLIGAAKAGVVMTPVNWRLAPQEARYVLQDSQARLVFVGPQFHELVPDVEGPGERARTVIAVEAPHEGRLGYEAWRDAQPSRDPQLALAPDAPAVQLYTSGTTGYPKGAVLTHHNFVGMPQLSERYVWSRWSEQDVSLAVMPCFHIGGTGWAILGLLYGALNVILREFDPTAVLAAIETHRISKLFLVPAALQALVRHPRARQVDYSHLRYVMYGASPMPLELLRECMQVFGCGFVQLYGMTETTGSITALAPEDHDPAGNRRMSSAGRALPGVELRIVDAAGTPLPAGVVGEVAVRSASTMQGYWQQPEATAQTIDEQKWLRTGDAGYLDEDGYLYLYDRIKDMIISGGENIYPAEVENAIFGHPDVAEVAVIGVPSERWGEEVKAVIVARPGAPQDAASIIAWARARIATYKAPKSVDFVNALPRNGAGKILRRQLRAPYWEGRQRQVN